MKIPGSISLITGACQGFGRAFTKELLKRGGKVCTKGWKAYLAKGKGVLSQALAIFDGGLEKAKSNDNDDKLPSRKGLVCKFLRQDITNLYRMHLTKTSACIKQVHANLCSEYVVYIVNQRRTGSNSLGFLYSEKGPLLSELP